MKGSRKLMPSEEAGVSFKSAYTLAANVFCILYLHMFYCVTLVSKGSRNSQLIHSLHSIQKKKKKKNILK